jgi:hypothetical protein
VSFHILFVIERIMKEKAHKMQVADNGHSSRTRASKARNLLDWVPNSGQPQFEEEIRDVVLSMSKEST